MILSFFCGKFPPAFLYNKLPIMETNKILQADYLDLIFDNRNKAYGGYELRKHYNQRVLQAFGLLIAAIALAVAIPYAIGKFFPKDKLAVLSAPNAPTVLTKIEAVYQPPKTIPPPIEQPKSQPNASIKKTVEFVEPKVVADAKVDKPLVKPDFKDDAEIGLKNNVGNGGKEIAKTTEVPTGPPVAGEKSGDPHVTTMPSSEPMVFADVMPEYPGGLAALMKYLQSNMKYPAEARENAIQGKVIVKFVVNEMGRVENAIVVRGIGAGCDKEALRVVNAMKGWKPGMMHGKAVKVYYTLPITFRLGDS